MTVLELRAELLKNTSKKDYAVVFNDSKYFQIFHMNSKEEFIINSSDLAEEETLHTLIDRLIKVKGEKETNVAKVYYNDLAKLVFLESDDYRPTQEGMKFDGDKDMWSLLPVKPVEQVVKVLTMGAKKYAPNNWKKVSIDRYESALMRHLVAWKKGEKTDSESGLPHLAHALTNIIFIMELEDE